MSSFVVRAGLVAVGGGLVLLVGVSCAERRDVYLEGEERPSGFGLAEAGTIEAGEASLPEPAVPMCALTTCSLPWANCPSSEFPCSTNLTMDDANCGACGVRCGGTNASTFSRWSCVEGRCAFSCVTLHGDCDGDPTNGCEAYLRNDPNNCGSCGIKCPAGFVCDIGECVDECLRQGKPDRCFGSLCVNLKADDEHCGTCTTQCDPTGPALPTLPADMYYGCGGGNCGVAKCIDSLARNCNGLLSDGCEVMLHTTENCNGCGDVCAPGKTCELIGNVWGCYCADGETNCGGSCKQLNDDPEHCGGCHRRCPGLHASHYAAVCTKGSCGGQCEDGYADCDELLANGCEVKTRVDNRNCGACGNACAPEQVCFQGKCQVTACDAGVGEPTK